MSQVKTESRQNVYLLGGEAFSGTFKVCDTLALAMDYFDWYICEHLEWKPHPVDKQEWIATTTKGGDELTIQEYELMVGMEVTEG